MLKLVNVTKEYIMGDQHFKALKGINLSVEKGELIAIVGPSGSGKSTTMNIIGLLDHPTEGHYYLAGEDVSNVSVKRRAHLRNIHIGFIFQSFFLLPRLSALQNVGLPLMYRGIDGNSIKKRAMEMLEKVGMQKFWAHRPSEMSGGQQQRVAIARALVGHQSIILADEPTGALDTKTSEEVLNLLKTINREENATTLIITHNMKVAEECQRIVHVSDGLIVDRVY
jgi:putative ABC transport system ATP-binding protein